MTCPTTASSSSRWPATSSTARAATIAWPRSVLRPRPGLLRRRGLRRAGRPGRHPDPRVPRPDRRLRPLPRPQVRPDPHVRLLRPGRHLRQHRLQGIPDRPARGRRRLRARARPRSRRRRPTSPPSSSSESTRLDRLGVAARGFGPVHARRLDPAEPNARPSPTCRRPSSQGRRCSKPRSSSTAGPSTSMPRPDDNRPAPGPLAEAGRRPGPQARPLGRRRRPGREAGKVAAAFGDYARTTLALRDAIEAQRVAALANAPDRVAADLAARPGRSRGRPRPRAHRRPTTARSPCPRTRSRSTSPPGRRRPSRPSGTSWRSARPTPRRCTRWSTRWPRGPEPADMKVFLRGNPATPGPDARRRFLSVLDPRRLARFSTGGSGRLELARAIASPANPLTARVMVNRVWEHHFGRGLVATPSNFGKMGERPSHPRVARLPGLAVRRRGLVAQGAAPRDPAVGQPTSSPRPTTRTTSEVDPGQRAPLAGQPPAAGGRALARRDAGRLGQLDPTLGGPSSDLASPGEPPADLLRQGQPAQPRRPAPPVRLPRPQHHEPTSGPSPPCRSSNCSSSTASSWKAPGQGPRRQVDGRPGRRRREDPPRLPLLYARPATDRPRWQWPSSSSRGATGRPGRPLGAVRPGVAGVERVPYSWIDRRSRPRKDRPMTNLNIPRRHLNRRDWLRRMGGGFGALGLAGVLASEAKAAIEPAGAQDALTSPPRPSGSSSCS